MNISRKIDALGGMVQAVKDNYPQREIAEAAFALQQEIDAGARVVVGVNRYARETKSRSPRCASTLRSNPSRSAACRPPAPPRRRRGRAGPRRSARGRGRIRSAT